jgi:hypothetical protein
VVSVDGHLIINGQFANGQLNGFGRMMLGSFTVYEGCWLDGKWDGFGMYYLHD